MLYISTSSIQTNNIFEAIRQLLGITRNIELSGGCLYDDKLLQKLIKVKQQEGINFLVHGYFPPPPEHFILNFADTSKKTRVFLTETMRYVKSLGIGYYSIHAGFKRTFDFENELLFESGDKKVFLLENIESNIEWFVREFSDTKIAVENLYPNNRNKECCFMMHVDKIVLMMERFSQMYLLLDLGHLKVSSRLLGFDYLEAAGLLFEKYSDRIVEIHLSENDAINDSHFPIYSDSAQYAIIKRYAELIKRNKINVTIEARNYSSVQELLDSYLLVHDVLTKNSPSTEHKSKSTR
ncbi:MAG: hypothetical protein KGZ93_06040 [Actinobacteria bacterium]|nr:hypothetical protein [Actinomycetota bacterium]